MAVDELSGAPEDVSLIMSLVPRGHKTLIHQHPQFEPALHDIVDYCVNIQGRRSYDVWATLTTILKERYLIEVTPATLKSWCWKYVLPNITIPKSYVMRAIVEKGRSLDLIGEDLEIRDELKEAYERAVADMYATQTDGTGRLVRIGATGSEVAALAKARLMANEKVKEELERYGIIPERRPKADARVDISVDVRGAMGSMMGGGRMPIVDVTPRESEPSPRSQTTPVERVDPAEPSH